MDYSRYNWSDKVILIAEDVDSNYDFLEAVLNNTCVKIIRARDGLESIEICRNNKVDLVLMDVKMPFMNGFEATIEIKKIRNNLPIIAQTAYASDGDEAESRFYGCDGYLAKPIFINDLLKTIHKFIIN